MCDVESRRQVPQKNKRRYAVAGIPHTRRHIVTGMMRSDGSFFSAGGYLHGVTGLTYGVDIERIRWMGILQRIAVGYYSSFVRDMASMSRDEKSCPFQKLNLAMVKCSVRGYRRPACNSAGMIDRYILGIDHLYAKPVYRNMKECNGSNSDSF
uniref:Uncharacterized protein n=1 Tax=Solanum lycopersicum TaxID=4081 RepID=A0A3Q7IHP0_SOLLC